MSRVTGEMTSSPPDSSLLRVVRSSRTIKRSFLDSDLTNNDSIKSVHVRITSKQLTMDSEEVQNFVATTGCPVYTSNKVACDDVAVLLLMPEQVDPDKVCCQVPPSCPGIGNWLFVVNLDHIDPDDMPCDSLGSYHKPHSKKHLFLKTQDGLKRLPQSGQTPDAVYDYYIRVNSYNHKDKGNLFSKYCYTAYNTNNEMLGPYGVVRYAAQVDPSTLKRVPHRNSKTNKPSVRTRPSTIKQAKALLLTQTPREVMKTMETAQSILGQTEPGVLPKGVPSITCWSQSVPGAKKCKRGRPKSPSKVTLADEEEEEGEQGEVEEIRVDDGDHYLTPAPARTQSFVRPQITRTTTPSKFDALKIQVYHSERRKNDTELQKLEIEKDNLLAEREKIESESEFYKTGTDKLHLEMSVLKAKKAKLDMELAKMRKDEDVVVVRNGRGYLPYD